MVGARAARFPDLVRRAAAEGHAVENHTWSHAWLPGRSRRRIEEELDRCSELIAALTGRAPSLVRPPYGHRDLRFYRAAARRRLVPALWSLDSLDWLGLPPRAVARRLLRAAPGDILLCHDGAALARATVPAIPAFLASAARAGLAVGPLPAAGGAR